MSSRHLVDPELLPPLDALPSITFNDEALPIVRDMIENMTAGYVPPDNDGVVMRELEAPGEQGAPPVRILFYEPERRRDALIPLVVYIHGGGFFSGRAIHTDGWSRLLVRELGCAVAAVDYRLAPETPFPGPLEDCYAAQRWLQNNAAALRLDAGRIAIKGVSAGGGLAAALALLARDRKEMNIAYQMLIYPMLDDRTGRLAADRSPYIGEFIWTHEGIAFGWGTLLSRAKSGTIDLSYSVPARVADLGGLPPTFIGTGALDALMTENVNFGTRLIHAGVPVEMHVYPGAYHGFDHFDGGKSAVGQDFRDIQVKALRKALVTP